MPNAKETALENVVARLEQVTQRLETIQRSGGGAGAAAAPSTSTSTAGGGDDSSASVQEYDEFLGEFVNKYHALSTQIGGDVAQQADMVKRAFEAQRAFLVVVANSQKPSDAVLAQLMTATEGPATEAINLRETKRSSKQFSHLSALSEGIMCLQWVRAAPKPGPHVSQCGESADFHLNRVLKDADAVGKDWVKNLKAMFPALAAYIKKNHTTGPSWNPRGGDAASASASAPPPAAAAAAPAAGGPPGPPPPAPPADFFKQGAAKPAADSGALMAALSQGGAVTSGLKKVTADMQTHKNPNLRAGALVQEREPRAESTSKGAKAAGSIPTGTAKFALEGNKWVVEYQVKNPNIELTNPEAKHTVYIYGCQDSVIQIKDKVNSIVIDSCKKIGVVFTSAIAACEIVNCKSVQVQVQGKIPSISIDKCSGAQVFLSRESLDTEIITAKSDEMNVSVPGATDNDDPIEMAVPEQYKTIYDPTTRKLKTEAVRHE